MRDNAARGKRQEARGLIGIVIAAALFASMAVLAADTKISDLPSGAPAQAGDMIPIARSGANYKLTVGNILAGGGDASTNTSSSVDSEIALFSSGSGKMLKRATTTGVLKGTAGVIGSAAFGDITALWTTGGTCNSSTFLRGDGSCITPPGSGDASTNTTSSVDSELAIFSGTGGKTLKRATTSGVLKGTSGVVGSAAFGDVTALWTAGGTCNSSTWLRGDGQCTAPSGTGTVTHTAGALTANSVVLGAGSDDTKVAAGIITDGTSKVTLGQAGTSVGAIGFNNATSGQITVQPVAGALGTVTISLPASTGTVALTNGNIASATQLASNPGDCSSNQFANAIDASGNLTCSALTLAGAQFANQGTTSTVLHGNASGNPSFGAVATADLAASLSLTTPNINAATGTSLTMANGGSVRTGTGAGNTLLLQAYDVDGAAYTTFGTLTANNTPTLDLAAGTTIGGQAVASFTDPDADRLLYWNDGSGIVSSVTLGTGLAMASGTLSTTLWHAKDFPAAGCNNATAATFWDLPTSNAAVPACRTGSNVQKGVLDFADGANLTAQTWFKLPLGWYGTIDVAVYWISSTTTGNVVWQVAIACAGPSDADDPAFTDDAFTATTTAGSANVLSESLKTAVTTTGTCVPGDLMHIRLRRDSAHASDTMAGTARVINVQVNYASTLQ